MSIIIGQGINIGGGSGGIDPSDATATASDILAPKTAYIADGSKATGTITSKSAETYTPTISNQVINAGQYLSGAQTVLGDANLVASNIKKDVIIFGVTGTHEGGIDPSDATATAADIATGKTAYIADGSKATGTMPKVYASNLDPVSAQGVQGDIWFIIS